MRVVSKGNYIAVVCEREEHAIRAARQLKVTWKHTATPAFPPSEDVFTYMRTTTPSSMGRPVVVGNVDAALSGAATVLEAEYDVPFQGHTAFGPAHATADPSNDQLTIYSNDMKSYGLRNVVARFLNMPRDRVRVVWMQGPQAYGRTAADDAGFEAAFLAKELGRPVRVQWMRQEETAWDTKGPAYAVKMRGALHARGSLVALSYDAVDLFIGSTVNPYASATFRTQFAPGYLYPDALPREQISAFFDPAYLTQSVGVAYAPSEMLTIRAGVGVREILTSSYVQFADDPATTEVEKSRVNGGLEGVVDFKWPFAENMVFLSRLETFANFDDFARPYARWDNAIVMKVNTLIAVNFDIQLISDPFVSPRTQIKQALSAGFSYTLL